MRPARDSGYLTQPAPALAITRRIPFEKLAGFPPLFQRYAAGDPAALAFFGNDWRADAALAAAARRALAVERDRETISQVLSSQNSRWGNDGPEVRDHIAALARADATVVITGQQLGLLGGPLYTAYKAITAIQLARRTAEITGHPVVPMFWLADEDHDWDEVRSATVVRRDKELTVELESDALREPVGRRQMGEEIGRLFDELDADLPRTAHTPDLIAALRRCYAPGANHRDAFARWMAVLFRGSGLVVVSGDDARLKRLAGPVFRREIEDPSGAFEPLLDASSALGEAGFHEQVRPSPGNLFLLEPEGRLPLDPAPGGGFVVRGAGRRFERDQLLDFLDSEPERFSPNVVLRPVMEDALLPVVAYVAGPGEVSYYAQLRGVYDHFGVPMPVIYPRASVTIVEPRIRRVLDRLGLGMEELGEASEEVIEKLHRRLALDLDRNGLEEAFTDARARLDEAAGLLREPVSELDPSLARSTESVRVRLQQELDSLERKVVRAQKRAHSEIRDQLHRVVTHLVPGGKPQERVLSPVHFANRLGLDFAARLMDSLSLATGEHQMIDVD